MEYLELKTLVFDHLMNHGFIKNGKDSVYRLVNSSFILVKPRKHSNSISLFSIDTGIFYGFQPEQKKETKLSDCHLTGDFARIVDRLKIWDLNEINTETLINEIDTMILPYLEEASNIAYIKANYPDNHDRFKLSPDTITQHEFLCSLK